MQREAAEALPFCSFCGKCQDEVKLMVKGPFACICNGCVRLAAKAIRPSPKPRIDVAAPVLQPASEVRDAA